MDNFAFGWVDLLHMAFPFANLILLVLVFVALRRAMRAPRPSTCIRTGNATCILIEHPDLLCQTCQRNVNAAIAAERGPSEH